MAYACDPLQDGKAFRANQVHLNVNNRSSCRDTYLTRWVLPYTLIISALGLVVFIFAFNNPPEDLVGLVLLSFLAAISEWTGVELFRNSKNSTVSVAMVVAMATLVVFGFFPAVLVQATIAIVSVTKIAIQKPSEIRGQVLSWLRRWSFNIGILVISIFLAGQVYQLSGGLIGDVDHVSNIAPLILAVITNTFVNLSLLIGLVWLQTGLDPIVIFQRDFQWSTPINVVGGILGGGALALAYEMYRLLGVGVFFLPVITLSYSFRVYANNMRGLLNHLEESNNNLDQSNLELLKTLAAVIDAYDLYTSGHSTQVAVYAGAIADKLGLTPEEREQIVRAALIHDLGKVGIAESIISKQGPLTDEEYNIIKRHPVIGADIVKKMKGMETLVPLVRHHHERWDGGGYPDGLSGEDIPLGARILALVDSLDTMCSDRPYRPTMSFMAVVEEVKRCSRKQFDPQVVKAFFSLVDEKSSEYFKNSAAIVDQSLLANGAGGLSHEIRYLKKSMLAGGNGVDKPLDII
jgi:putative nucleotidyltransferase with HDIG domain